MRERTPMNERPTLGELASQAAGTGYACPRCGCKDWRGENGSSVESVRHPKNEKHSRRRRICRNCGQSSFTTFEVFVPDGHTLKVVPEDDMEVA